MQKYGATDVSTRTVHDLLTTINTMSLRIKSLERYEHALREIHKVIIMMRPGFNLQLMDLNAMPALIVQFFSDMTGRDMTGRDITHNINYKYDYNFNGALPFQTPPPQPFYGEHGLQQPPPQPPFQPPPPQPPFQPPPQPPFQPPPQPPFQPPPQQPPQPPLQQPPQPPLQQPSPQPLPQQTPCQTIVPQIELTVDEMRDLQNVYQNMQQQTITWDHLGALMTTMIRIMQVRVVNSVTIVNAINSLKNVTMLTNFDFNDFLQCVARETAFQFTISPDLCRIIVAFIQFFQNTYSSITLTLFKYVNLDDLIVSTNSMHVIIVQLYEFYTKIYFFVMQTSFVYTNSDSFVETTAMLYNRIEALTASAQSTTIVSGLQEKLREERSKNNILDRDKNNALKNASDLEDRYKNLLTENRNLKTENERLTLLENESQSLSRDNDELLSENNRLKEANTELLKRSSQNYKNFKNEQIKVKAEQEKIQDLEKRLQDAEDMQVQNVNDDAQNIITELKRSLKEKENELQEVQTLHSNKLTYVQSQIDLDAIAYREKLASMEQEFTKTINERNDTIKQLNETLTAGNLQNYELAAQLKEAKQELSDSKQNIIEQLKVGVKKSKFGDNDDEIIEFALNALDVMYKKVKQIDPNLGNLLQDSNNINPQLSVQQRDALNNWLDNLSQIMTANDILNLNAVINMAGVKNQIAHIIPANMLRDSAGNLLPAHQIQNADNVVLISAVSMLVSEYNRLAGEISTLTATSAAQSEASALIANCSQQIAALQEELRKNKEDFEKINNLVQTSSPQLNDKTIQLMKTELDTTKSQLNNLKKITNEQLKQMADNGVQVEMSKLNTQIDEINSLLLNSRTVTQDILDWKTNMMELYESLARSTAEMETI
uniref:Viral desmoplakin N-terminal domain-containing protein n=1 Tax=Anticarsia gemmatalis multiple nucleopolyhedrovirus TaxID=268591 RepID=A0A0S3IYL9_9ABAC|nr:hypothetical protein AGNV_096 [Anticarsia gemmatalis multiple nucleopolyhedrovirus]AXE72125.1 hypothetical protein [Anticarsia gemmatalis multiple nucleopolyhedrovirus]